MKPNTAGGGLARVTTLQPAVGNGQLAYPHPAFPERRVLIVATPAALGQRDVEWMIVEILRPGLGSAEGVRRRPIL